MILLKDFETKDAKWKTTARIPKFHLIDEAISFFSNCSLTLSVASGDEKQEVILEDGIPKDIVLASYGEDWDVELFINRPNEDNADIYYLELAVVNMTAKRVKEEDIVIAKPVNYGSTLTIDFDDALSAAVGLEEVIDKEVQIKDQANHVMPPIGQNFSWHGNKLSCRLAIASEYHVRIRYSTEDQGWLEWSGWHTFSAKRKLKI